MAELVCQHFHEWKHFGKAKGQRHMARTQRRRIREMFPEARRIEMAVSYQSSICGTRFEVDDVALLGVSYAHACGKVWYILQVDDEVYAVLEMWPFVSRMDEVRQYHRMQHNPRVVPADHLKAVACAYRRSSDGHAVVRVPLHYSMSP